MTVGLLGSCNEGKRPFTQKNAAASQPKLEDGGVLFAMRERVLTPRDPFHTSYSAHYASTVAAPSPPASAAPAASSAPGSTRSNVRPLSSDASSMRT